MLYVAVGMVGPRGPCIASRVLGDSGEHLDLTLCIPDSSDS